MFGSVIFAETDRFQELCKVAHKSLISDRFCERTAQKRRFSIVNVNKPKLRICSHSLKNSLMENLIFCAVTLPTSRNLLLFKVNNGNTTTRCEICSKSTIKTPEQRQ